MRRALITITSFLSTIGTSLAASLPFADVPADAPYYSALSSLYEQGVITLTPDKLFRPNDLMNRDLFVSLVVGVGCKKCITPSVEDIIKYRVDPFVDLTQRNLYFYCVSYAKENTITQGYTPDASGVARCEDGTTYSSSPFCPANHTSRIEGAAMLLRRSNLWNDAMNTGYKPKITIPDVTPYWQGYAEKAIEIGIIKQKNDKTIGQDEKITKAEFVMMAGTMLAFNQCNMTNDFANWIDSGIRLIDAETGKAIEGSVTPDTRINIIGLPEGGEENGYSYAWRLTNATTRDVIKEKGQTIDAIQLWDGMWIIELILTDSSTGKQSNAVAGVVSVSDPTTRSTATPLASLISTKPSPTNPENTRDFSASITGGDGKYAYSWDFGDGKTSALANPSHTYDAPGKYIVTLTVTDGTGKTSKSQVTIEVGSATNTYDDIKSEIRILDNNTKIVIDPVTSPDKPIDLIGLPPSSAGLDYVYNWTLTNIKTNQTISKTGENPQKITLSEGIWNIALQVTDPKTGQTSNSLAQIVSTSASGGGGGGTGGGSNGGGSSGGGSSGGGQSGLSTNVTADPMKGNVGDTISFASIVSGGNGQYMYNWTLGDGTQSTEKNPKHIYDTPGIYTVVLITKDTDGNIGFAQVVVSIGGDADRDGDGVKDSSDLCPDIRGSAGGKTGCPDGTSTNHRDNLVSIILDGTQFDPKKYDYSSFTNGGRNACIGALGQSSGLMLGAASCTQCPCDTSISILADLRQCDILFPAILSPDKKNIYSRGKLYQIP